MFLTLSADLCVTVCGRVSEALTGADNEYLGACGGIFGLGGIGYRAELAGAK